MRPLLFFPVDTKVFSMRAGLLRFPSDFGHGRDDERVFLVDDELPRALESKRGRRAGQRYLGGADDANERAALEGVLAFMQQRLAQEAPERWQAAQDDHQAVDAFDALGRAVQEDFAVVHEGDGQGKTLLLHVSFPSGWRPETLWRASFLDIHVPVPGFPGKETDPKADLAARSMVTSMVERGPFVRFVWTVRADDHLDHHPEHGGRKPWTEASPGYFRVERQLTWPFPALRCSLFVIRTFVYPFPRLDAERRQQLAAALQAMPLPVRRYKGIPDDVSAIVARLRA